MSPQAGQRAGGQSSHWSNCCAIWRLVSNGWVKSTLLAPSNFYAPLGDNDRILSTSNCFTHCHVCVPLLVQIVCAIWWCSGPQFNCAQGQLHQQTKNNTVGERQLHVLVDLWGHCHAGNPIIRYEYGEQLWERVSVQWWW